MRSPVELILRFRRRDVLMILPLSLVAAGGALVWLPPMQVLAWLGVNLAMIGAAHVAYTGFLAAPTRMPGETATAAVTFAMTALYSSLPMLLLAHGMHGAAVAGLAMMAAMALSATSEIVFSWPIGFAALAAVYLPNVVGLALSMRWQSPANFAVAVIADTCFFAYVIGHAVHRRKIETELAEARLQAEAHAEAANSANLAKSEFLAAMSHEIRTPLNGVIGMAQVMEIDDLTPPQRERLSVLRQSGEILLNLLNDVLDLAKIEAGKFECEWTPFEVDDLVRGAMSVYGPLARRKGLVLGAKVAPDASGTYRGDPARIRQILNNLISNALKFTERGEITLDVSLSDGALVFRVTDTGIGMAKDRLHRLFQKFSQLDASTTRRFGGTGLGLAISRQLTELMGGRIEAASEPGAGSTFWVTLPLERIAQTASLMETPEIADVGADDFTTLRVLAAEDNAVNRLVLTTLLDQAGIALTLVEDGAAAVAACEDVAWDLILMDIQMPVMDGVEATRAIRALERRLGRARTPIIALTANAMTHQRLQYEAVGMDACVSKPIRAEDLFAEIQNALSDKPSAAAAAG